MELTPELLLEAKFGPARRGYDMAEVDDFLERCAEGLDVLLARLRAEFERAERAESRLAELDAGGTLDATVVAPPPDDLSPDDLDLPEPAPAEETTAGTQASSVDESMRILVHAERTAEAAVADARAEADRIRTEAESVAGRQRSEAEQMLATAKAEAEEEARKAGEETKRSIQAEVLELRRDRDGLSDDIRTLRRWLDEQRTRMRTTARELQRIVEDPSALKELDEPSLSDGAEIVDVSDAGDAASDAGSDDPGLEPADPFEGDATQAVPIVGAQPAGSGNHAASGDSWSASNR